MAEQDNSTAWDGPSAKDMIASHTLAQEIIQRHGGPYPVFDDECIEELRRFISDPSRAQHLLREMGIIDAEGNSTPAAKSSLTGHIMTRHGTDEPALTGDEIHALKEWFDNGGGKTPTA